MRPMQASRKQAINTVRKCLLESSGDQHATLVIADDNMYYRCGLNAASEAKGQHCFCFSHWAMCVNLKAPRSASLERTMQEHALPVRSAGTGAQGCLPATVHPMLAGECLDNKHHVCPTTLRYLTFVRLAMLGQHGHTKSSSP